MVIAYVGKVKSVHQELAWTFMIQLINLGS